NGLASTVRTLGAGAGTQTTTATATLAGGSSTVTFNVNATVGGATQMTIESGDAQVDTVGQTLPVALAVRVIDQFNNPVAGVPIGWTVTDGGGTVNPPSSTTNASGIATTSWTLGTVMSPSDSIQLVQANGVATGTLSSTKAEAKTVSARVNTVLMTQTATVTVAPAGVAAAQSSLSATSPITAATGTSTITATARDAFANPIPGATVVLAATGTGNTLIQPSGPTNASGVATGTLSSTVAEAKTVSATIGGTAVTQTATVTVTSGSAVSPSLSTVSASPTTLTAASGTATITVTVKDANGNPISGATVVPAAPGTANTLTQPSGPTNASGVATGTLSSIVPETKTVSATINGTGVTQTATVSVTAGPVSASQSTLSASPTSLTAGSGTSTITVTVKDDNGNPVSGATVALSAT